MCSVNAFCAENTLKANVLIECLVYFFGISRHILNMNPVYKRFITKDVYWKDGRKFSRDVYADSVEETEEVKCRRLRCRSFLPYNRSFMCVVYSAETYKLR